MVFPNSRAGCSRVPPQSATLTQEYCYPRDPVRLACLIHATSVRSEPESNSQKKKVLFEDPRGSSAPHTNIYCFLKNRLSKIDVRDLSGERVHSISKNLRGAQGGILKNFIFTFSSLEYALGRRDA